MSYSGIEKLIPKDKFDFRPFPELMKISEDEIKPILPNLFEWTKDIHWPIAREVINVLCRFPNSVIPYIQEVLNSDDPDDGWQNVIISMLIPRLPVHLQVKYLFKDVKKIAVNSEYKSDAIRYMENYYGEKAMKKILAFWRCEQLTELQKEIQYEHYMPKEVLEAIHRGQQVLQIGNIQNKYDIDVVKLKEIISSGNYDEDLFFQLTRLSEDKTQLILPELFDCFAKMNWSIIYKEVEMIDILSPFPDKITLLIKETLKPTATNEELKCSTISKLLPKLPIYFQNKIVLKDIKRINISPTDSEKEADVLNAAKLYLDSFYGEDIANKILSIWRGNLNGKPCTDTVL